MADYNVNVSWKRNDQVFTDNRYSRVHLWQFDGGIEVTASSSPHNVPLPYSQAEAVDPEEAFVAALSSCHLLSFLYIAAKRKFRVDGYADNAVGQMEKNASDCLWIARVILQPVVTFSGEILPTEAEHEEMHHSAHQQCFIANSVKTDVQCKCSMQVFRSESTVDLTRAERAPRSWVLADMNEALRLRLSRVVEVARATRLRPRWRLSASPHAFETPSPGPTCFV